MREIKFRAWDNERDKYMYGVEHEYDGENLSSFADALDDPVLIPEQYTCLKDEDGKEVYEGDVVASGYVEVVNDEPRSTTELYGEVKFNDGVFYADDKKHNFPPLFVASSLKVIGNIHENPELLDGSGHDGD